MEILKMPVLANQYYSVVNEKKYIFLHHTSGSNAASAVAYWNSKPDRVATPYIIERSGEIFETFDPKYWAYALGVKGGTLLEKASIHIELVAWGGLSTKEGKFFTYTGKEIKGQDVTFLKEPWRGYSYFHKYTDEQIESLHLLLDRLRSNFFIPHNIINRNNFWQFRDFKTLPHGIWSHTTVRKDKSDICPQDNLVEMVKNL